MKIIATHDGAFHTDEVCAVALLQLYLESKNIQYQVVRTRDKEIREQADFVLDMGGVFDATLCRFDHHQHGGAGKHPLSDTDYATCGLIWATYGMELCGNNQETWDYIESKICIPVDAFDNGIILNKDQGIFPQITLGEIISGFNRKEIDENDHLFANAVTYAKQVFSNIIETGKYQMHCKEVAREIVSEHPDDSIIIIDEYLDLVDELIIYPWVTIFVYPKGNRWRAKCVRSSQNGFATRVLFPEKWYGLRDEYLEEASGIKDLVFCHRAGFTIAARTKEAILEAIKFAK